MKKRTEPLWAKLNTANKDVESTKATYDALRQGRREREQRRETMEAEVEIARHDARASELVPGGGAVATEVAPEVIKLEEDIRRADTQEAEARQKWKEAVARRDAIVRKLIPQLAESVKRAKGKVKNACEKLGTTSAGPYVDDYLPAIAALEAGHQELAHVLPYLNDEGVGPRLAGRQRAELRKYLRTATEGASDEARLGFLVARLLAWSRMGSSPVERFWKERGLPELAGSCLYVDAIPDRLQLAFQLKAGRLPI